MKFLKFIVNLFTCKKSCSKNKMPKTNHEKIVEKQLAPIEQQVDDAKKEFTIETCCLVDSQEIELELFETSTCKPSCNLREPEQKLEIEECKQEIEGGTLLPFMKSDLGEIKKLVEDVKISINESEKKSANKKANSKSLKSKKKTSKKAKPKKKSTKSKKKNN